MHSKYFYPYSFFFCEEPIKTKRLSNSTLVKLLYHTLEFRHAFNMKEDHSETILTRSIISMNIYYMNEWDEEH